MVKQKLKKVNHNFNGAIKSRLKLAAQDRTGLTVASKGDCSERRADLRVPSSFNFEETFE